MDFNCMKEEILFEPDDWSMGWYIRTTRTWAEQFEVMVLSWQCVSDGIAGAYLLNFIIEA